MVAVHSLRSRPRALTAALVCGLLLALGATAHAQKKHPAEEKGIKSFDSGVETTIRFQNHGPQTVKLYWLDTDGKRVHKATLKPNDLSEQKTYLTHPWLVTDEQGNALAIYFPDAQARSITLGNPFRSGASGDGVTLQASSASLGALQNHLVQEELKLTREQLGKVEELARMDADALSGLRTVAAEERSQKATEIARAADGSIAELLSGDQKKRLAQILRQQGTDLFRDAELLRALQLTPDQQQNLGAIHAEYSVQTRALASGRRGHMADHNAKIAAFRKATHEKITALLTPAQLKVWDDLVGRPTVAVLSP
jgi:hypothetical protein